MSQIKGAMGNVKSEYWPIMERAGVPFQRGKCEAHMVYGPIYRLDLCQRHIYCIQHFHIGILRPTFTVYR
jgi:hypothetical protein